VLSALALMLSVWSTREGNERMDRGATTEQFRRLRDNLARVSELRGEATRQADPAAAIAVQDELALRMVEAAELADRLGDQVSSAELVATAFFLADAGDPRAVDVAREAANRPMDDRTRLQVLPRIAAVEFRFGNPNAARGYLRDAVAVAETVAGQIEVEDPEALRHELIATALLSWAQAEATFGDCVEARMRLDEAVSHAESLGPSLQDLFALQSAPLEDALAACI
jgi:hypothetical protein